MENRMKNRMGKIQSGLLIGIVLAIAISAGLTAFILFDTSGTNATLGPEFSYDIERYAEIAPALILYQQVGQALSLDFEKTNAIAVDTAGQICVAGDTQIVVYAADGSTVKRFELDKEPTCLAVDQNGIIMMGLGGEVKVLNPLDLPGTVQWEVPADNALLTSIAFDDNSVFAADAVNKVIWRYDRKGELVNKIGEKNEQRNIPGFIIPSPYFDIAMAQDGLLRAVNPGRHLIEAYTVDGDREWAWGKASVNVEGFSGCCNPINFAILPDGGFVTCEKGLVRVKVYDADGNFIGVVAGPDQLGWVEPMRVCETPEQCSSKGFDVAVDDQGRIYILDMVRNNIRIFEKK